MSGQAGLSRSIHRLPGAVATLREHVGGESVVRHVFGLIWPQARIDCVPGKEGCRVDVRERGLCHVVLVPWAMVEADRGLCLARAVFRRGLPGAFERAVSGLSLSL